MLNSVTDMIASDKDTLFQEETRRNRSIIEQINMEAIDGYCREIYYCDPYTAMHAEHVADLMAGLAMQMALRPNEIDLSYMVGIMHDVGKIRIPLNILTKPGRLTDEEFEIMKQHAVAGAEMISDVDGVKPVISIMRHHHERYDGAGYPDGLTGTEIPLLSRMLAVCDSFDAMTTKRCYRTEVGLDECVREIQRCAGTQFDPNICEVFLDFIKERFGFSL
ncbi:MAG: metal dependent phosphohydrolase [Firmicutes bacterium]|nr:metal dependent phosphohydrolase [Bacillota bacterium]